MDHSWGISFASKIIMWVWLVKLASSDPGINFLGKACNSYNVFNISSLSNTLNITFAELRTQLKTGKKFATAEQPIGMEPAFTLIQCRGYMSASDCVACFNEASVEIIRSFPGASGAHVVFDGCVLRYENNGHYYGNGTTPDNTVRCDNQTTSATAPNFQTTRQILLTELETATPRINGFYAATKKDVIGAANETVYGIAQCGERVTPLNCQICLHVAFSNLQKCSDDDTDGRAIDSACFMRFSDRPFFADNQTTDLRPFLKTKGSSTSIALIIGGVAGGVAFLLMVALIVRYKKVTEQKANHTGDILDESKLRGPMSYKYKDLKFATQNFKEDNKLGVGGFGDVYKGTLKNGKIVAVKKPALDQSNKADFKSEVTLISNVQHHNLVRLLGYCSKGPTLLLVYEYMANKSLDHFLFGKERRSLNWKQRFDVILGTAQGLAYLHEQFHVCIIHRDIKPNNILLDDNFKPKIADFGLARLLPDCQSHLSTRFAGTMGYIAPEYAIHGQLSKKVDTFSYGIVVLEIISGKICSEMIADPGEEYLLKRAWNLYEEGKLLDLVDERLDTNEFTVDVEKVIEIALMCTQSSPNLRPSMSEITVLLNSKTALTEKPLRPTFIDFEEKV